MIVIIDTCALNKNLNYLKKEQFKKHIKYFAVFQRQVKIIIATLKYEKSMNHEF